MSSRVPFPYKMKISKIFLLCISIVLILAIGCSTKTENEETEKLVYAHAKAWETGDYGLIDGILHKDIIFAYPGRRMNKQETLKDFLDYNKSFENTKIYINRIIVDGDDFAVEWQFASTNIKTAKRTAVSDAIIGNVRDGKIAVWKEYLDGRVGRMQAAGNLSLEEGQEPFPWPKKK